MLFSAALLLAGVLVGGVFVLVGTFVLWNLLVEWIGWALRWLIPIGLGILGVAILLMSCAAL